MARKLSIVKFLVHFTISCIRKIFLQLFRSLTWSRRDCGVFIICTAYAMNSLVRYSNLFWVLPFSWYSVRGGQAHDEVYVPKLLNLLLPVEYSFSPRTFKFLFVQLSKLPVYSTTINLDDTTLVKSTKFLLQETISRNLKLYLILVSYLSTLPWLSPQWV